ncbi:MAG: hypothetical protein QOE68_2011, partial [Thermoanaerobaculia bacterium]|nr:hypothetical protein [Thermoanaerobaculia bacterium]
STKLAKVLALSALALMLAAQPVFATPKRPSEGQSVGSVLRSIIRHIRDLTDISFPPG